VTLPGHNGRNNSQPITINTTGKVTPAQLVAYAQTLKGITYKYGSSDPGTGFDCSGFITYVFNHFGVTVPRSSVDFTYVQHEIPVKLAKPGDIILYTGTDSTKKVVGHMGIIVANNNGDITFIHSTSGKANGVTETPLNAYYQGRCMKTLRIFSENDTSTTP
jgi:lipoprotein Spr